MDEQVVLLRKLWDEAPMSFAGQFDKIDRMSLNPRPSAGAPFRADYLSPTGDDVPKTLDQIKRWQDAGGTHFSVRTLGLGFTSLQQHLDFFTEVRARFK
jgi:hypothetical protein